MARKQSYRVAKPAIVIIVDGDNEKWYISQARAYYPNNGVRSIKIKPEMVQHKRCRDLFESAHQKLGEGASSVFLVLDLDTIRKDARDLIDFHNLYSQYIKVKSGNKSRKKSERLYSEQTLRTEGENHNFVSFWLRASPTGTFHSTQKNPCYCLQETVCESWRRQGGRCSARITQGCKI